MKILSPTFDDGGKIPSKYTCDGADISPRLDISQVPPDAKSLAVVVDDPDAPGGVFDHWVIWNIRADIDTIPEEVPKKEVVDSLGGALQGKNDFGSIGYRGPCPPGGPAHRYRFKAYALDEKLDLDSEVLKKDLEKEMEGHVLSKDEIVGKYSR